MTKLYLVRGLIKNPYWAFGTANQLDENIEH